MQREARPPTGGDKPQGPPGEWWDRGPSPLGGPRVLKAPPVFKTLPCCLWGLSRKLFAAEVSRGVWPSQTHTPSPRAEEEEGGSQGAGQGSGGSGGSTSPEGAQPWSWKSCTASS